MIYLRGKNAPVVITRYGTDLRYQYITPYFNRPFKIDPQLAIGKTWAEMGIPESEYKPWQEKFMEALHTKQVVEYESAYSYNDGVVRHNIVRVIPEMNDSGEAESLIKVSCDITERKKAEQALRDSEEMFRSIFQSSRALMAIISNSDNKYKQINKALLDIIEYKEDEILGHTAADLNIFADAGETIAAAKKKLTKVGDTASYEVRIKSKTGQIRTILKSVTMVIINGEQCRVHVGQDITAQKELEQEVQRLDRLNVIGEMAASIGHEIRNPMTTVRGYLQLFERRPEFANKRSQITTMIEELDRANGIITEFLSLAKNKKIQKEMGNLATLINTLFPLIRADAFRRGHDIELILDTIPDTVFDHQEMRQLIHNLTRNALEAMEDKGLVTIRTYSAENTVVLEIQDKGCGIPEQMLVMLGKPFFTTKESGTGLGLPICYRIAERHNAELKVKTSPAGTVFSVHFRLSDEIANYEQQELFQSANEF